MYNPDDSTQPIRRREDVATASFGDDLVALDINGGAYFSFNTTAAYVWELLAKARTFDALCGDVAAAFEVEDALCRTEVRR